MMSFQGKPSSELAVMEDFDVLELSWVLTLVLL